MKLEQMRFTQKIKQNPHDRGVREEYARWLDEQGRREEASEQRRKARQAERFNPEFDYKSKLEPLGLEVSLYVGGEIVSVHDDLWTFWADPAELQLYLERTPPDEITAGDLPLHEHMPSEEHLQRLWETVPGDVYKLPAEKKWNQVWQWEHVELKELPGNCWITRVKKKDYRFSPENICGLQKSNLVPI